MVSWGSALLASHGTALIYFGKCLQGFYMIFVEYDLHCQPPYNKLFISYVTSWIRRLTHMKEYVEPSSSVYWWC